MVSSLEVESNPAAHSFWYGAVIGIFHADVQHSGAHSCDLSCKSMDFLWVRWLGVVPDRSFGRKQAKLPQVSFVEDLDEFGFLNPALIICGCHLILAFTEGRTTDLLSTHRPTEARPSSQDDDWINYYVNMWVPHAIH